MRTKTDVIIESMGFIFLAVISFLTCAWVAYETINWDKILMAIPSMVLMLVLLVGGGWLVVVMIRYMLDELADVKKEQERRSNGIHS